MLEYDRQIPDSAGVPPNVTERSYRGQGRKRTRLVRKTKNGEVVRTIEVQPSGEKLKVQGGRPADLNLASKPHPAAAVRGRLQGVGRGTTNA